LESGNASAAEKLKAWAQCLDKCAAAKMRAPFVEGQIDKWRKAIRVDYREDANCGLGLQMIWIPGGPFTMGAPESEANAHDDEKPARQVTVDGFWMAKCETTNRQFRQFLKESSYNGRGDGNEDYLAHFSSEDASTPSGDDYPVVYVSWKNAVEFCAWLSRMTGQKYALPTEAQWEYSCRAGSQTPYSFGSDLARLSDYGWYSENSGEKTNPVGQKLPNKWGLHDMHGNVWEWCFDWYGPLSYGQLPNKNPAGLPTGVQHVLRGGSWHTLPLYLRSTHRLNRLPNYCDKVLGFRVVRNEGAQVLPAAPPSPNPVPGHDFTEEYIDLGLKMLWITGGEFLMGSSEDENHDDDECPQHKVELDGFWLGRHEVTVEQFRKFAQAARYKTEAEKRGKSWGRQDVGFGETEGLTWVSPGFEQLESHPVVHVSWNDAAAFCRWLSEKTGRHYGLPTEAQWEYACRAGSRTTWSWGDGAEGGEGYLNGRDHSFGGQFSSDGSSWGEADQTLFDFDDKYVCTSPVGIFKANRWRVCDMHGNVREWCFDRYSKQYSEKAPRNPRGTTGEDGHVMRGGSWLDIPERVRSAYRERAQAGYSSSWVGFRVAAEASQR
jgi:formylglycine-generating enzyme required for sulfatase activity